MARQSMQSCREAGIESPRVAKIRNWLKQDLREMERGGVNQEKLDAVRSL